jgi:hypothetical protein
LTSIFKGKEGKTSCIEFIGYTIIWWDQLITIRRCNEERHIDTWEEMKSIMRKRFVLPSHYYREVYNRLQFFSQGSKSVDEYFKEMKIANIS